jgi:hypothetical protein
MTGECTCKAEHWQPHADSCPAKQHKRSVVREYVSFQAQLEGVAALGSAASHLVLQSLVAQAANVVERLVLDKEQLRGNLSLAEEGLANYALEVERKNSLIDLQDAAQTSLHAENVRLRMALQEIADSNECPELPQMARDALGNKQPADEPLPVDPNGPPHELRPLLENALKALGADVPISPGSYFHDELKRLLTESAAPNDPEKSGDPS